MITLLNITGDDIYLNGDLSTTSVSDFCFDLNNIYSCKLDVFRRKSGPVLKKLFGESPVYTSIKITVDTCVYHIRKVILSIMSISEKMKINVSILGDSCEEGTFKRMNHDDIILLRYCHLFESLLNRKFGKCEDLVYYGIFDSCYKNIFASDQPSVDHYSIFQKQISNMVNLETITEDYYLKLLHQYCKRGLFCIKNNTIFPDQSTIDKYKWLCGYFDEYFHNIKNIISKEMDMQIEYNYLFFDPMIDVSFQKIIDEVSGR